MVATHFRTTDTLKEVNRMAIESEEIGSASLQTLEGQRESLNRSISKVDEVKTNANQSKQLLQVGQDDVVVINRI